MSSEREINIIQKAAMFDLINILEKNPEKTYSVEELKTIINAYLANTVQ